MVHINMDYSTSTTTAGSRRHPFSHCTAPDVHDVPSLLSLQDEEQRFAGSRKGSSASDLPIDLLAEHPGKSTYARLDEMIKDCAADDPDLDVVHLMPPDEEDLQDLEFHFKQLPLKGAHHPSRTLMPPGHLRGHPHYEVNKISDEECISSSSDTSDGEIEDQINGASLPSTFSQDDEPEFEVASQPRGDTETPEHSLILMDRGPVAHSEPINKKHIRAHTIALPLPPLPCDGPTAEHSNIHRVQTQPVNPVLRDPDQQAFIDELLGKLYDLKSRLDHLSTPEQDKLRSPRIVPLVDTPHEQDPKDAAGHADAKEGSNSNKTQNRAVVDEDDEYDPDSDGYDDDETFWVPPQPQLILRRRSEGRGRLWRRKQFSYGNFK